LRFSRAFFPIAVTILIAVSAIIISLGMANNALKKSGHNISYHSLALYFKNIQDFQEIMLLDYSEWNASFNKMTIKNDMKWFYTSIGNADIINTTIHGMAFIKNDSRLITQFTRNNNTAYALSKDNFNDDFIFIKETILENSFSKPTPLSFFTEIQGFPALISFSPITHPNPEIYPDFSADQRDFLVFWTILTPEILSQVRESLRFKNLSLTDLISPENYTLKDSKGRPVSSLQWELKKEEINPLALSLYTSLAMFALLLLGGYFSYRRVNELIRQLDHARKEAEDGHKIKSEFLATMSHELRTPLNSIIGFSDVLTKGLQGELSPQQKEYADYIHSSGEHLLTIINEILDMSKIEAGRYQITEGEVDINATVMTCNALLRKLAEDKNIRLEEDLADNMKDMVGDAKVIKQILFNIVSNAIKFTPKGGLIKISSKMSPKGNIKIKIKDNGCGIEEDKLEHIIKPYIQAGDHKTRSQQGTGLGLAISDAFMKMHQGNLDIKSTLNEGTCIILTFPAERVFIAN